MMKKKLIICLMPTLSLILGIVLFVIIISKINNYYKVYHYSYASISIDVYCDKEEYNIDDEINIRVEVKNVGKKELLINTNYNDLSKLINIYYGSITIDYNNNNLELQYNENSKLDNEIIFKPNEKITLEEKYIAKDQKGFRITFEAIINGREVKIEKIIENIKIGKE